MDRTLQEADADVDQAEDLYVGMAQDDGLGTEEDEAEHNETGDVEEGIVDTARADLGVGRRHFVGFMDGIVMKLVRSASRTAGSRTKHNKSLTLQPAVRGDHENCTPTFHSHHSSVKD